MLIAVFFTDPEYKTTIGSFSVEKFRVMLHMRRDHDDVAGLVRLDLVVDVDRDISLEKKLKFIITVRVAVHTIIMTVFQRIIIVINFKISGQHILSGTECTLQIFFHRLLRSAEKPALVGGQQMSDL